MPRIPNPRRLVRRVAGIGEDILGGAADLAGSLTGGTLDTFGGIGDIAQRAAEYVSSAPAAASGLSERISALSSALGSAPSGAASDTGDILGGARSLLGWGTDAGGTVTADLGDVLSRARAYTGDVAGGLPDAAQRVLSYEPQDALGNALERTGVTGLGHRLTEGLHLDQLINQSPSLEQAGNLLFTRQGGAGIDTSNPADLLKLQGRFAQVGHAALEEPIAYGLNALTGGAAPGGPFSGTQTQALHERAGELPGPLRYAGAAGTTALDWATDPTTWALGAGNLGREIAARGLAGGLGAEAANLGKFAALAGIGGEAAADLADRLRLATTPAERERARMVGNLAAPVAGGVAERLLHRPTVLSAAPEEAATPRAPWQMPRDEFIANRRQPARGTPEPTVDALRATVAPSGPSGISVEPGMLHGVPMPQLEHNVVYRDDQGVVRGVLVVNHSVPGEPPLLEVAVEPAYRGRGIAQALYQAGTDAGLPIDEATGVGGYTEAGAGLAHRRAVTAALGQGKSVPPDVLADYPDLAAADPFVVGASARPTREPDVGAALRQPWEMTEAEFLQGKFVHGAPASVDVRAYAPRDRSGFFSTTDADYARSYATQGGGVEGRLYATEPPTRPLDLVNDPQARARVVQAFGDEAARLQAKYEAGDIPNPPTRFRIAMRELEGKTGDALLNGINNARFMLGFDYSDHFLDSSILQDIAARLGYNGIITREGNATVAISFDRPAMAAHRDIVAQAIADGKPVPPSVLAEYPDLAAQDRRMSDAGAGIPDLGVGTPDVADLHAGFNPLTGARAVLEHPRVFGPAIGAAVGYGTGDTPEERAKNAAIGAVAGFGLPYAAQQAHLGQALNEIIAPARNRPAAQKTVAGMMDAIREGEYAAHATGGTAGNLGQQLLAEVRSGGVQESPARAQAFGALEAQHAPDTPVGTNLRDFRLSVPAIMEQVPNDFQPAATVQRVGEFELSPRAQDLVAKLRGFYNTQLGAEQTAGVAPNGIRDNYVNRAWERPPPPDLPRPAVAQALGAKQGFQKATTFDDYLSGILAGYTPRSLDIGDLMEARLRAGQTALAHGALVDTMRSVPDVIKTGKQLAVLPAEDQARYVSLQKVDLSPSARMKLQQALGGVEEAGYVRKDYADAIQSVAGASRASDNPLVNVAGSVARLGREALLGLNVGHGFRVAGMGALQEVAQNPFLGTFRATGAVWDGLRAVFSPAYMEEWRRTQGAAWAKDMYSLPQVGTENVALGLRPHEGSLQRMAARGGPLGLMAKAPAALETAMFQKFVPVFQTGVAQDLFDAMKRPGMSAADEAALHQAIGHRVALITSGTDPVALGLSQDRRAFERLVMLAPNWTRGQLQNAADVFRPGPEGTMARRFWATTIGLGIATSAGLSWAFSGETDPKKLLDYIDPRSPDSVTNPTGRNFLAVALPDGGRMQLPGISVIKPLAQALLTPVAQGIKGGTEAADQRSAQEDFIHAAVRSGLAGLAGAASGAPRVGTMLEGKLSVPAKMAEDFIRDKDRIGPGLLENPQGVVTEAGRSVVARFTPMLASPFSDERPNPAGVQTWKGKVISSAAEQVGARYTPPSADPGPYKDTTSALLTGQGIDPGADPIGTYRQMKGNGTLDRGVVAAFERAHPEIPQYITQKRQAVAAKDAPGVTEALRTWQQGQQVLAIQRHDALLKADETYRQTSNGVQYRKLRQDANDAYFNGLDGLAQAGFAPLVAAGVLGAPVTGAQDVYDLQAKRSPRDPLAPGSFNDLLDQYERIRPVSDSREDMDAYFARRQAFLDNLPADTRGRFQQYRLDRAPTDTERRYIQSADVYGQYAQISSYAGMTPQQAEQVNELIGRARDRARYVYGGVLPVKTAILLDTAADPRTRVLAMLAEGNKLTNPARKVFVRQHARDLAEFFSTLTADDLANIRGAA